MYNFMIYAEQPTDTKDIKLKYIDDFYSEAVNEIFNNGYCFDWVMNEYPMDYFYKVVNDKSKERDLSVNSIKELNILKEKLDKYVDTCNYIMVMKY